MISEEINRIKNIMGIVLEQDSQKLSNINSEEEYVSFLKKNGFKVPNQEYANSFFSASKVTLSLYEWLLINPKTKVYSYKDKSRQNIVLGRKSILSPKENKTYNGYSVPVTIPPKEDIIKEFITEPLIIDESHNLDSIIRLINDIRNVWGPGVIKIESGKYKFNNKEINPEVVKTISKGTKTNIEKAKELVSNLPQEDTDKQVTSKNGETYNNVNDYISKIETEAKELKLIS